MMIGNKLALMTAGLANFNMIDNMPEEDKDKLLTDLQTNDGTLQKVFMLRDQFDQIGPEKIKELEQEHGYIIKPISKEEFDAINMPNHVLTMAPSMPEHPEIPEIHFLPSPYQHRHGGSGKSLKLPPKNAAKKRKAKARQQKQSRKRNKK